MMTFHQLIVQISKKQNVNILLSAMTIKHGKTCRKEKRAYTGKLVVSAIDHMQQLSVITMASIQANIGQHNIPAE